MNRIMVEMIFWTRNEDVPIRELGQSIGIFPVECRKMGEVRYVGPMKNHELINEESSLLYSTGYVETIEVLPVIKKMMNIIKPKEELIVDAVKKYELNARFCIVIETDVKHINLKF